MQRQPVTCTLRLLALWQLLALLATALITSKLGPILSHTHTPRLGA